MAKPKEIAKLTEIKTRYEQWLESYKKAHSAAPIVQRNLEMVEFQLKALEERPDEADEMPLGSLAGMLDYELNHLPPLLPMVAEYNQFMVLNSSGSTTGASSSVYNWVIRVGDLGTPETIAYAQKYTDRYSKLQNEQKRPEEVRTLIEKLNNPQTLRRFDDALHSCYAVKSGIQKRTDAANDMRNLISGIKGDLYELARKWEKEDMTWATMIERLSIKEPDGSVPPALAREESNRTELIRQLSSVTKDREGGWHADLDYLWSLVLDHIYVILTFTRFDATSPKQ